MAVNFKISAELVPQISQKSKCRKKVNPLFFVFLSILTLKLMTSFAEMGLYLEVEIYGLPARSAVVVVVLT